MIAHTRRFALVALSAAAALVAAQPLGAQDAAPMSLNGAATASPASGATGPTIERAAVGARSLSTRPATTEDANAALQQRVGLGQARALMVVGFGALIIGLLIGDDVGTLIAVGGAAVGLYGLYHYLK